MFERYRVQRNTPPHECGEVQARFDVLAGDARPCSFVVWDGAKSGFWIPDRELEPEGVEHNLQEVRWVIG